MKLLARRVEGRTIHRMYNTARAPLQRVLLSDVLSSSQHYELCAVAKALDPLRLFQQVERLRQAFFRCEAGRSSDSQSTLTSELLLFDLAGCAAELTLKALQKHLIESIIDFNPIPAISSVLDVFAQSSSPSYLKKPKQECRKRDRIYGIPVLLLFPGVGFRLRSAFVSNVLEKETCVRRCYRPNYSA